MTERIQDVMTQYPVTVGPLTSLTEAARRMRDADIGDVLIVDGERLDGVVTDRDLVVRGLAEGRDPNETTVHAVRSPDLVTVGPGDSLTMAAELMRAHALRRLPVTEDGRLVGIVTIGDLAIERDSDSALADISAATANR
ncbi:CBS domain-containing protein [Kitasatospora sp. NPDC127111]|uniref:CBS domain-containing protein n=1 Tax=Kitasatospora sp. NPDC127111 TaxID=3345363 RepID=UPI0036367417